jgi:hypothetical protein
MYFRGIAGDGVKAGYPGIDIIERVNELIREGSTLYEEQMVDYENLHRAKEKWISAIDILSEYEMKLPLYYILLERIKDIDDTLCARFREHKKQYEAAMVRRRYDQAITHANIVFASCPDEDDSRNIWAKKARIQSMRARSHSTREHRTEPW